MSMNRFERSRKGVHIKTLIPIWIQGLPDDAAGVGLLRIHRDNSKWVRETEDFALGQTICGDDCKERCEEHSLGNESGYLEVPVILSGFLRGRAKVG